MLCTTDRSQKLLTSPTASKTVPQSCKTVSYDPHLTSSGRKLSQDRIKSKKNVLIFIDMSNISSIAEMNALKKANKSVNSISAIINTKEMTIQVSQAQGKGMGNKKQNKSKKRRQSQTKTSLTANKFDKSGKYF